MATSSPVTCSMPRCFRILSNVPRMAGVCCGMSCSDRLTRDTLRAESGWPREASSFERRAWIQEGGQKSIVEMCVC